MIAQLSHDMLAEVCGCTSIPLHASRLRHALLSGSRHTQVLEIALIHGGVLLGERRCETQRRVRGSETGDPS